MSTGKASGHLGKGSRPAPTFYTVPFPDGTTVVMASYVHSGEAEAAIYEDDGKWSIFALVTVGKVPPRYESVIVQSRHISEYHARKAAREQAYRSKVKHHPRHYVDI